MSQRVSRKEAELLEIISSFIEAQGFSPTYRQLQHMLGLSSVGTIQKHILRLKAQGLLTSSKEWRSLKQTSFSPATSNSSFRIPVIGSISKGKKIDLSAKISLCNAPKLPTGPTYYGFRIQDSSFADLHFAAHDLVIIEARSTPSPGETILISSKSEGVNIGKYVILQQTSALETVEGLYELTQERVVQGILHTLLRQFANNKT